MAISRVQERDNCRSEQVVTGRSKNYGRSKLRNENKKLCFTYSRLKMPTDIEGGIWSRL